MSYNDFEKSIYKELFDKFQKEEHHVEFAKNSYNGDFDALKKALYHLADGQILFILYDENDIIEVELNYTHCYDFVEL